MTRAVWVSYKIRSEQLFTQPVTPPTLPDSNSIETLPVEQLTDKITIKHASNDLQFGDLHHRADGLFETAKRNHTKLR